MVFPRLKTTYLIQFVFFSSREILRWSIIFILSQVFNGVALAHHLEETEGFSDDFFLNETLTGNWDGLRTRLQEQGWVSEFKYSGGLFHNPLGGIKKQTDYAGFLEVDMHADLQNIVGWPHAKIRIDLIHLHGTDPSNNLFTAQTVSNLEGPDQFKVFLAWIEQFGWNGRFSFKAGIYSLDTEFDFKESANLFINGVFGTGLDLSETGITGPAVFPNSALGARLYLEPVDRWYLQAALVDGVPGNPSHSTGTHIRLSSDDGLQVAAETGYHYLRKGEREAKAAIGSLLYTTDIPDLIDVDGTGNLITHSGTFSVYGFIDWPITFEKLDPSQGTNLFLRLGKADPDVARFEYTLTGGAVYTGFFPGRPQDLLGIGFSGAWNSDKFRRSQSPELKNQEWVIEVSHQILLSPGFEIQPNLQYFINPGSRPDVDDAFYLGGTFNLAF